MQSKIISLLLVVLLVVTLWGADMSKSEVLQKIKFLKMAHSMYPFINGYDYQTAPETIGKYFTDPIYQKLKGNDLMGFSYNPGFGFSGNAFNLKNVKILVTTEKYRKYLINSLSEVSKELKFSVQGNSRYELGICIVGVKDRVTSDSLAGVLLELYARDLSTKKTMFMRVKGGDRGGWYEGMKNAWRYIYLILKSTEKNGK